MDSLSSYNASLDANRRAICEALQDCINHELPEASSKLWHGAPVWFLDGNPIVGYFNRKSGVALLFWSGQSFNEPELTAEGKFKAAQILYTSLDDLNIADVIRWVNKSKEIQWDYKNIVKKKGVLELIGK